MIHYTPQLELLRCLWTKTTLKVNIESYLRELGINYKEPIDRFTNAFMIYDYSGEIVRFWMIHFGNYRSATSLLVQKDTHHFYPLKLDKRMVTFIRQSRVSHWRETIEPVQIPYTARYCIYDEQGGMIRPRTYGFTSPLQTIRNYYLQRRWNLHSLPPRNKEVLEELTKFEEIMNFNDVYVQRRPINTVHLRSTDAVWRIQSDYTLTRIK